VNDYDFLWMAGKSKQEVESYVPQVVRKITMGVEVSSTFYSLLFQTHHGHLLNFFTLLFFSKTSQSFTKTFTLLITLKTWKSRVPIVGIKRKIILS
jgi:hypothetical protein